MTGEEENHMVWRSRVVVVTTWAMKTVQCVRRCDCGRIMMIMPYIANIRHCNALEVFSIPATFPLSATSGTSWPCEFGSSRRKSVDSIFSGALLGSNIGQRLHLKELGVVALICDD